MWEKIERVAVKLNKPALNIRDRTIAINASALNNYRGIKPGAHVNLLIDNENSLFGFKITSEDDKNGYSLGYDGGSTTGSLVITCSRVIKNNTILKDLIGSKEINELHYNKDEEVYYISTDASLVFSIDDRTPKHKEIGAYKYISEGEVVYIGQGLLSSRFADHSLKEWVYDDIMYSVSSDKERLKKIESSLIKAHIDTNGKLPIYNRIKGANFFQP